MCFVQRTRRHTSHIGRRMNVRQGRPALSAPVLARWGSRYLLGQTTHCWAPVARWPRWWEWAVWSLQCTSTVCKAYYEMTQPQQQQPPLLALGEEAKQWELCKVEFTRRLTDHVHEFSKSWMLQSKSHANLCNSVLLCNLVDTYRQWFCIRTHMAARAGCFLRSCAK